MEHHKVLETVVRALPTDYADYGGAVERWAHADLAYPDCSCCKFACYLEGSGDWLVCANPDSPRAGLLTWEHQAGHGCCVADDAPEEYVLSFPELGDVQRRVRRIEDHLGLAIARAEGRAHDAGGE